MMKGVRQISLFVYLSVFVPYWQEKIRHKGSKTQRIHKENLKVILIYLGIREICRTPMMKYACFCRKIDNILCKHLINNTI